MEDNIHPAVKLLLARMETNPDEFCNLLADDYPSESRWRRVIDLIVSYGREEEKNLICDRLSVIVMNDAHEEIMRKLLNGEEEPTLKFATSNRYNFQHAAQQQSAIHQQSMQGQVLASALGLYNQQQQQSGFAGLANKINNRIFGGKK
jgi:hypothetical protein